MKPFPLPSGTCLPGQVLNPHGSDETVCPHDSATTSPSFLTHTVQMKQEEDVCFHQRRLYFLTHTVQMKHINYDVDTLSASYFLTHTVQMKHSMEIEKKIGQTSS